MDNQEPNVRPRITTTEIDSDIPLNSNHALGEILTFLNPDRNKPSRYYESKTATLLQFGGKLARIEIYDLSQSRITMGIVIMNVDKHIPKFKEKFRIVDLPKKPGDTTGLYRQVSGVMQEVSNATGRDVVQKFSTQDPKMIAWMRTNATQLGFTINEDYPNLISASRVYLPISHSA